MPIKLRCKICEQDKPNVTKKDFITADGICEQHNVCDDCFGGFIKRPDRNYCPTHKESFVIFINFTSVCRVCVEKAALAEAKNNPEGLKKEWKKVARLVPLADKSEFLKLIRAVTQPRMSQKLCWACAKHSQVQCYNLDPEKVVEQAIIELKINHSLVITMLPSSDPAKRYRP